MPVEIDPKTLAQIRKIGGDDLLKKLLVLFLENTPMRLEEIRRGIAADDLARTAKAVHSLRSSSITLGATELAAKAAELEQMAHEGNQAPLVAAFPSLEELARSVLACFEEMSPAQS